MLSFIAFSCDEFVEPDPKDRITPEVALGDLDGAEAFLFAAYTLNVEIFADAGIHEIFVFYGDKLSRVTKI